MSRDLGLLILRMAGFYLALGHGWGKVYGLASGQTGFVESVAGMGFPLPALFAWVAALSELVGGIAVAVGLYTRWAAVLAGLTMFVAAFVRHRALSVFLSWIGAVPASEESRRAWGNPELATIFLLICAAVALLGPGRLSIDAKLGRR